LRRQRLPLRGADLVLTSMHAQWKHTDLSNNALLVVECDAPLDPDRVRRAVDRLLEACPWPAARLTRSFPWARLEWTAPSRRPLAPPPIRGRSFATPDDLHHELEAELNCTIHPAKDPPLRFLIAQCERAARRTHGVLALTWFHPLMDPRGAQNLLRHLSRLDGEDGSPWWGAAPPSLTRERDPRPLRERGPLARKSLAYMQTLAPIPPVSPGTGLASPGPLRFKHESFRENASLNGGRAPREICWRLAVVGKAMADLWQRRGLPDVPFLVPIAVDLRPKGEPGPTFGNCLAFHFARFAPSETADTSRLAGALRLQMADAVRDGQIEANAVAMDFLQHRPLSMMLRALPWAAGGETFSFNCADVAEFPVASGTIFGRRILNAYHAPAVLPRPGIGIFFNRCGVINNVVSSWVEGAVEEDEVTRIMRVIREAMGWTAAS
jgi:hypothetical protein